MKKAKILLDVSKKGIKKIARGEFTYRGQSPVRIIKTGVSHARKHGAKETLKKLKKELVIIHTKNNHILSFPNGLVCGVDKDQIANWYKEHGRKVSIVIPSYNDYEVLKACVRSIWETVDDEAADIIIVDDYCKPESREYLKEFKQRNARVIFREENGGFAKAVNTGIEAADKSHDVILVNSDIVAHIGWLEALQYGGYEFGVDVGIIGPKLLYPDGRIQSAGSYRNTEETQWFDHYYRFQESNYGPANIPQYCLAITGACLYIKREFINYVGSIDTNYQFAFEDVDLCLRGWQHKYRTLYFPAAELTHMESATRKKNATITEKEQQSITYFWEKWGDWFDSRNVKDSQGRNRIIFVLQSMGLSGGIKIVIEHANSLSKKGFAVEIWTLDQKADIWAVDQSVRIRSFRNYDRLIQALSGEEAIKVATWWETAFPVWLSSVNKGIPVYYIQEIESWFYPDDVRAQASVISCYRKEFINMTTSQYNYDEIRQLGLKATPIPCGYDDDTYKVLKNVKRKDNQLLAVGRTFFQKNFKFTFRAWKSLGEARPPMTLFGAEPEMAKMDPRITYCKKPSNEEVNKLYNESTVFVQTSIHEGFCLPLLEAMAAGCPVVCTDNHGNRDFCFDGKNCLMVERDDDEALANAITKLMTDEKLRTKLSKEALKTVKRYKWDKVNEEVFDFYSGVAKKYGN